MHPTQTARGSFDATLVDADGNVDAMLTQGEYAANPSMNDAFRASVSQRRGLLTATFLAYGMLALGSTNLS